MDAFSLTFMSLSSERRSSMTPLPFSSFLPYFCLRTPFIWILSHLDWSLIFLVFLSYFPQLCLLLYFPDDVLHFAFQLFCDNHLVPLV